MVKSRHQTTLADQLIFPFPRLMYNLNSVYKKRHRWQWSLLMILTKLTAKLRYLSTFKKTQAAWNFEGFRISKSKQNYCNFTAIQQIKTCKSQNLHLK